MVEGDHQSGYYHENKDTKKAYQTWYYAEPENKRKKSEYSRNYHHDHKEHQHDVKKRVRLTLLSIIGMKCMRCGFDNPDALQIDHIYGGGHKESKLFKSKFSLYQYYINNPDSAVKKLQTLCPTCNWLKKHERKEHPKYLDGGDASP